MKYGYYDEKQTPLAIDSYDDGAHIIVIRAVNNFISTSIKLEDEGWELRDSIKVILQNNSLHGTLFRKPFKGTVANNVLTNGCGGINIDATRISHSEPVKTTNRKCRQDGRVFDDDSCGYDNIKNTVASASPSGRFPANLLLECTCGEVIEGKSDGVVINNSNSPNFTDDVYCGGWNRGEQEAPRAYKDTGATHTDSKCPCKKLDTQSGITNAVKTKKSDNRVENNNQVFGNGLGLHNPANSHKDSGGASRFFFSFKSRDELKEYLIALIRC